MGEMRKPAKEAQQPVVTGANLVEPPIANIERRMKSVAAPLAVPPGWPPDVHPGDTIFAAHMNAVRDSVYAWPGDVDAQGHALNDVVIAGTSQVPWSAIQSVPVSATAGQTPWLQNVNAAGYKLSGAGDISTVGNVQSPASTSLGHSFNLSWDGSAYRYVTAAIGYVLNLNAGALRLLYAPSGSVGSVATITEQTSFSPSLTKINSDFLVVSPSTSAGACSIAYQRSAGTNTKWLIQMDTDAGGNHLYFWRYDDSGNGLDRPIIIRRSTGNVEILKYLQLQTRTAAVDDAAAAAAGVAVGQVYHNAGALRVRLT